MRVTFQTVGVDGPRKASGLCTLATQACSARLQVRRSLQARCSRYETQETVGITARKTKIEPKGNTFVFHTSKRQLGPTRRHPSQSLSGSMRCSWDVSPLEHDVDCLNQC